MYIRNLSKPLNYQLNQFILRLSTWKLIFLNNYRLYEGKVVSNNDDLMPGHFCDADINEINADYIRSLLTSIVLLYLWKSNIEVGSKHSLYSLLFVWKKLVVLYKISCDK